MGLAVGLGVQVAMGRGLAVGLGVQVTVAARVGTDVRVPVPRTPLRGVASCAGSTCGEGALVVVAVGVSVRVGWSVSAGMGG
jgi:hypothetical protein